MIRIVLLDKAETSRYSLKFALQVYDQFVITGDGSTIEELTQRYPEAKPDAVIVSSFETGMQELNLVCKSRETYPGAKIILLGLTNLIPDDTLRNAGVDTFLPKTLSLDQLVQTIQETGK